MFESNKEEITVGANTYVNGINGAGETWAQVIANLEKEIDRLNSDNRAHELHTRGLVCDIEQFTIITNEYMNLMSEEWFDATEGTKNAMRWLEDMGRISAPKKTVTIRGEYIATHRYEIEVDIPVFDNEDEIDHEDHERDIADMVMNNYDPSCEIIPD